MPAPSDLVHETSSSTGTGNLTIANVNGKRSFDTAFGTGGTDLFDYYIMNRDAAEWERGTGHLSAASTFVRDTVIESSNAGAAVNFGAGTKDVVNDLPARYHRGLDHDWYLHNFSLAVSAAASALTIALKTANGSDPTTVDRVTIPFRSATGTTGTPVIRQVTAASSLVLSSGSTLGVTSTTAFRIWVVVFDDAGTLRLGAINCLIGTTAAPTGIYQLTESILASSTAEGGAGAADSAAVFYTGSAVTSKAYRVLGYLEWSTSGLTAGTWTTTNLTKVQLFGPGVKLPGDCVQKVVSRDSAAASGSTATPHDDTIPQNTEGNQFMTKAITPTSAANFLEIDISVMISIDPAAWGTTALFQDSTAGALTARDVHHSVNGNGKPHAIKHIMSAQTASSTTFNVRSGSASGATCYFNGTAGRMLGGVNYSSLIIQELMV
jgi:hypothetical protein